MARSCPRGDQCREQWPRRLAHRIEQRVSPRRRTNQRHCLQRNGRIGPVDRCSAHSELDPGSTGAGTAGHRCFKSDLHVCALAPGMVTAHRERMPVGRPGKHLSCNCSGTFLSGHSLLAERQAAETGRRRRVRAPCCDDHGKCPVAGRSVGLALFRCTDGHHCAQYRATNQ